MKEGDVVAWMTGNGLIKGVVKRWPHGELYAETMPGKGIPLSLIVHTKSFKVCSTLE